MFVIAGTTRAHPKKAECGDWSGASRPPVVVEAGKAVLGFGGKMGEPPVSLATTGMGETGSTTSIATVGAVPAVVLKKARPTKVSNGKGDRATEMNGRQS